MKKLFLRLFVLFLMMSSCSKNETGLKDAFKDQFLIGTAINPKQIRGNDTIAISFLEKHFNSVTSEYSLMWGKIHPRPDEYHFSIADSLVAFGEQNGMYIDGHVLIWHSLTPDWVFMDSLGNPLTREVLLERMKDHISTIVGRYKGKVKSWNVVNEAIGEDGQMRKSKFYEIIGEDYIQKAFEYAHKADPDAQLYYNDYNIELPAKREGTIKLLKKLQEQGVKIDGVGIQGHWLLDFPDPALIDSSIRIFANLGLKIVISELDIDVLPNVWDQVYNDISMRAEYQEKLDPYHQALPDSVQNLLAARYADIFKILLKYKDNIDRVTFWGLHDGYSWKNDWPIFGRTNYPLLFDRNYKPKPAFDAVMEVASR